MTVILVASLPLGTATVAAQEANETTTGPTAPPTTTAVEQDDVVIALAEDVVVIDYRITNNSVVVEIENRRHRPVETTVTDASQQISGAIDIRRVTHTLTPGQSTIRFRVSNPENPAITLDTDGQLKGLGEQDLQEDSGLSAPKESDGLALLVGVVITVAASAAMKRYRDRQRRKGVVRVDG
jgi:hypothetical protein